MTGLYPEFFNDVFGPISQPGSSSHMSGPCRAGYMAHSLLGEKVKSIRIELDPDGTFNEGFGQMNEDIGMLNGAYGHLPDADVFFEIKDILAENKIEYSFEYKQIEESHHPNAIRYILEGESGKAITAVFASIGGGMVETVSIDGFPFSGRGDSWVLFVRCGEGTVSDTIIEDVCRDEKGVFEYGVEEKGTDSMLWFKCESRPAWKPVYDGRVRTYIMEPVLPVLTTKKKKAQRFRSMTEWTKAATDDGVGLYEEAVKYEADASGWSEEEVILYMRDTVEHHMSIRIHALYEDPGRLIEDPFRKIYYREWEEKKDGSRLTGAITDRAIKYMHSAQAKLKGVLDVPGPMSNGGGYLYSVLQAVREEYRLTDEDVTKGLFIAAAIGAIAYSRTEPTGEIIGCAGECGVCAAMTAGAVTEMLGGTPEQVESAASMALQGAIGWPCDPIPGGQGTPCTSRTLYILTMPQVYSQWALMGALPSVPFHEVLDVADKVGRHLPSELLCTGRGGLCDTCTGRKYSEIFRATYKL